MKTATFRNNLLEAVYLYIKKYSSLAEDGIFQGGNNFAHLPEKHNNFAVINLLNLSLVGTNSETYQADTITINQTIKASVQVDVYGDTLVKAYENMEKITLYFRGILACDFFLPLGFEPLYAEDIKEIMLPDASKKYVPRLTTTLNFAYKSILQEEYETFDSVDVNVVNVNK